MTHDCYRARGWVGGWRVGASKGSLKSRSEEGQQACASRQLLPYILKVKKSADSTLQSKRVCGKSA